MSGLQSKRTDVFVLRSVVWWRHPMRRCAFSGNSLESRERFWTNVVTPLAEGLRCISFLIKI